MSESDVVSRVLRLLDERDSILESRRDRLGKYGNDEAAVALLNGAQEKRAAIEAAIRESSGLAARHQRALHLALENNEKCRAERDALRRAPKPQDIICPDCKGAGGFQGQSDNMDMSECATCGGTGKSSVTSGRREPRPE